MNTDRNSLIKRSNLKLRFHQNYCLINTIHLQNQPNLCFASKNILGSKVHQQLIKTVFSVCRAYLVLWDKIFLTFIHFNILSYKIRNQMVLKQIFLLQILNITLLPQILYSITLNYLVIFSPFFTFYQIYVSQNNNYFNFANFAYNQFQYQSYLNLSMIIRAFGKLSIKTLSLRKLTPKISFKFASQDPNKKIPSQLRSKEQILKQTEQQAMKADPFQDPTTYEKSSSNAGMYILLISGLSLFLAYAYMEIQSVRAQKKQKSVTGLTKISSTGKANIGGNWSLLGMDGKPFGSQDLQGSYYLIYFGFTNCPDICPNSLMKLSRAIEKVQKMPQSKYFNLKSVFVSVDPDRDTPQKIKRFINYFDEHMIGVTASSNNDPNLKQCLKKFKIYSTKIEFEDDQSIKQGRKSYTIDHTILTYLIDDENNYLAHLGGNLGEHDMAKVIVNSILKRQEEKMNKMKV